LKGTRANAVEGPKSPLATSNLPVLNLPVSHPPAPNNEARDPVCGMFVSVSGGRYKSAHKGTDVYFCCAGCKQTFDRQPEKYALLMST
ncbi:MAG: YHS domain-containing protein, partial [Terriglobales bacterium]